MPYVADAAKLSACLMTLTQHDQEIREYFLSQLRPRLASVRDLETKMTLLFGIANADRQGTGKGNKNLIAATRTFKEGLQAHIDECSPMNAADGYRTFWRWLCDIKGMNQKTANLFLKYVTTFEDELELDGMGIQWRAWRRLVDVPLDRWVLRLLGTDCLHVCIPAFEEHFRRASDYVSPEYKALKYRTLQEDLRQVALASGGVPLTFDNLWFVGSKFCSYRPLLCSVCWLESQCLLHGPVPWATVLPRLKSEDATQKRDQAKIKRALYKAIWEAYKSDFPESDEAAFLAFVKTPECDNWWKKVYADLTRRLGNG